MLDIPDQIWAHVLHVLQELIKHHQVQYVKIVQQVLHLLLVVLPLKTVFVILGIRDQTVVCVQLVQHILHLLVAVVPLQTVFVMLGIQDRTAVCAQLVI